MKKGEGPPSGTAGKGSVKKPGSGARKMTHSSPLMEAAFEGTITPLVILDRDFNFLRVNEAYARSCRMQVGDFAGKNHFALFPSDAEEIFRETVRTKRVYRVSARPFKYPDQPERGVTYWDWTLSPILDGQGEVEALVLSLDDVTERVLAEVELRRHRDRLGEQVAERTARLEEANRQLRAKTMELEAKGGEARELLAEIEAQHSRLDAVIRNMPAGIIIVDVPSRTIILSNRQAETILGKSFKPGDTMQDYLAITFYHQDGNPYRLEERPFSLALQRGEAVIDDEVSIFRGGEKARLSVSAAPVGESPGATSSMVIILHDLTRRHEMERALRESESSFRSIFRHSPIGIELYDGEGILLQVNRACLELFGVVDMGEIKGFRLFDDPNLSAEAVAALRRGEAVRVEEPYDFERVKEHGLYHTTRSGTIHVELHITPMRRGGETSTWGYLVQIQDITGRKLAEVALRKALEETGTRRAETEALLAGARAVLDYHEFGVAAGRIFDTCKGLIGATAGYVALLSDDGTRNEVVYLDAGGLPCTVDPGLPMPLRGLREVAYRTISAVFENSFAGSPNADFLPPGHAQLENVLFAPLVIKGRTVGLLGLANKTGGFTANDALLATSFGELAAVALQNARSMESLERSEERFRAVAQSANDAIISADSRGKIVFWNHGAEKMLGYPAAEILGRSLTVIFPERFQPSFWETIGKVLSTGTAEFIGKTVEMAAVRKGGGEFPALMSLSTWGTREGIFFTAIMRDIADHKKAEEEVKRSLKEKELLLKEIHHRVKNNLQIVSTLLNLQSDFVKDQDDLKMFRDSQARVRSMALIHDKLYGSRNLASIDFAGYLQDLVSYLYATFGVSASRVVVTVKAEGIVLGIDAAIPCGLIVNELVSNALKYAFPGERSGRLAVRLSGNKEEGYVLAVSDDGVGLPAGLDFRNTDSLGLQLVCILTDQLNGTIALDRDRGTEFTIVFHTGK